MDEANKPDNVERLVKEAAEGAQFEFNDKAWAAMEAKLDGKSWRTGAWWKFGLPVLALVLALLVLIPNGGVNVLNEKPDTGEVQVSDDNNSVESLNDQLVDSDPGNATEVSKPVKNDASSAEKEEELVRDLEKDQKKVTVNNQLITSKLKASEGIKTEYFIKETQPNENGFGMVDKGPYGLIEKLSVPERNSQIWSFSEVQPWILDSAFLKVGEIDSDFRRFTYGVVLSLDLSSTGLDGFTDPGTMVGILGEYRFNRNWAIQTGVAYSTKIYSALGSEYETPDWALNAPDDFASVLARCLVIDIPLNVKRYFSTQKGNQWFLSGGISSYLMLREDYEYEYSQSRPAWPDFWRYENRNNHFFGILNLSGGVVRPLTKKLNINIEPFMKLPLTGIGEGGVRFLSFGTNVSIMLK